VLIDKKTTLVGDGGFVSVEEPPPQPTRKTGKSIYKNVRKFRSMFFMYPFQPVRQIPCGFWMILPPGIKSPEEEFESKRRRFNDFTSVTALLV
jgi:hypothetical protein